MQRISLTKGGFNIYTSKNLYKVGVNRCQLRLINSLSYFFSNSDKALLNTPKFLYKSKYISITVEPLILDYELDFKNKNDLFLNYFSLIKRNIKNVKKLKANIFLTENFYNHSPKFKKDIIDELNNINKKKGLKTVGLIHGDLWSKNILTTINKTYFIDYDRSRKYSFIEFDLINYFIFKVVYKSKPNWQSFCVISEGIINKNHYYFELIEFISSFYKINNIINYNLFYFDNIFKLYLHKIIYDNDKYLTGLSSLKWFRKRYLVRRLCY